MDSFSSRSLHYATAVACGVFAALAVHIALTVLGLGIDAGLRTAEPTSKQQFIAAVAWWATAGAGFVGGWGAGLYLIAAARGHEFIYRLARGFLIAIVVVVATVAGILSKTGAAGGAVDVVASLTALGLGLVCAFCGARLAYLNAERA